MSATTSPTARRVTLWRAMRSEWVKAFTLPSTWWVLAVTVLVVVGFGALIQYGMSLTVTELPTTGQQIQPSRTLFSSDAIMAYQFGQLILAAFAVWLAANEYGTGQVRVTFSAVPARWRVLTSKAILIAVVGFVTTVVASYAALLVSGPILARLDRPGRPAPVDWRTVDNTFTAESAKLVFGLALATTLVCLFALAVGALLRNTTAGIVVVIAVLFVLPTVLGFIQVGWISTLNNYMIGSSQTGLFMQFSIGLGDVPVFGFPRALVVTGLWAGVPLLEAGILLAGRDA